MRFSPRRGRTEGMKRCSRSGRRTPDPVIAVPAVLPATTSTRTDPHRPAPTKNGDRMSQTTCMNRDADISHRGGQEFESPQLHPPTPVKSGHRACRLIVREARSSSSASSSTPPTRGFRRLRTPVGLPFRRESSGFERGAACLAVLSGESDLGGHLPVWVFGLTTDETTGR